MLQKLYSLKQKEQGKRYCRIIIDSCAFAYQVSDDIAKSFDALHAVPHQRRNKKDDAKYKV